MKRRIALALTTGLIVGMWFALGGMAAPVHASGSCYYNYSPVSNEMSLGNGHYIETTLSIWSIDPASGCTQWSGHDWGDTIAEVTITSNTGKTFNNDNPGQVYIGAAAWSADNADGSSDANQNYWLEDSDQHSQQGYSILFNTALPVGSSETEAYTATPIVNMASGECLYGMDVNLAKYGATVDLGGTLYNVSNVPLTEQIIDTRSC